MSPDLVTTVPNNNPDLMLISVPQKLKGRLDEETLIVEPIVAFHCFRTVGSQSDVDCACPVTVTKRVPENCTPWVVFDTDSDHWWSADGESGNDIDNLIIHFKKFFG